jgi:hypothetical protein
MVVVVPCFKRIPTTNISPIPPHLSLESHNQLSTHITCSCDASSDINRGVLNKYCHKNLSSYVHIYTDGSKHSNGSTAAAMYIPSILSVTTWKLNPAQTVIGSELFAICKALQFCCLDPRLSSEYSAVIRFQVSIASHPQHHQPLIQGVCF